MRHTNQPASIIGQLGLMDFFSILLPGALLTFLLMGEVGSVVLGDSYAKLDCA